MKRLLFLPLLLLVVITNAKTYYVSATGNDSNTGTSSAAAWKSLTKVNSFVFAANDSILFNRGDVFYGSVIVKRNNLFFSAYGTGAKPLITGFTSISSWKSLGGGIYEAVVNAKSNLNMVAINGRPQQIGRYPNANEANGGYLTYDAASTGSITDNQLSTTVNWTGAEVAIRKNGWTIDRCFVTSQSGGTINYKIGKSVNSGTTPQSSPAKLGHGYFFMDDIRTLDQLGEWYFDTTAKKIKVYFGTNIPTNYAVQVSTVDTLFNIANRTNISVSNISFEGANMSGIFALRAGYITVQYCDISNIGAKAVHIFETPNVLIENVNTNNVLSNAIQVLNRNQPNVVVRNCVARNTSPFAGMGSFFDDSDNKGMYLIASNNLLVEYNTVDSVGLAGIQFNGNSVVVKNNIVNAFCRILHDNGGIYTYVGGTEANPGAYFTNRTVSNNIIMNGGGAPLGTSSSSPALAGIYLDGRTMNVSLINNTVFNIAKNGIHCNNPSSITIRGNTLYNNGQDISFMRWGWGSISNLNVKGNISFPMNSAQKNIYYTNAGLNTPVATTLQANLKSLGSFDSNYYHTFTDAGIALEIYNTEGGEFIQTTPFSLDAWRTTTNYDKYSKAPAQKIQPFTIVNTVGANLFSNPQFNSNINGTTIFGTGTTATWDNTSKITGTGSLRIDFSSPTANKYSILHSPIGAVSSNKKYVLRFTTLGTKVGGVVRSYLRKSSSPYNNLVSIQAKAFGTSKLKHEFLLNAPVSEAGASFVIEVEQTSGTTYIDDVEFIEVNATINPVESQVKFLYNDSKLPKIISLDAKYIGVDSVVYNGTITLAPYSSRVIVKAGAIGSVLPVELMDFSAKNISEKVEVKWVTTGEVNSSHYLVERSTDGRHFESITNITSNNRQDIQSTYNFNDNIPPAGIVYYRLVMVDKDGSFSYSKIVSLNIKNSKSFVIDNVKLSASSSNVRINITSYQSLPLSFAVVDAVGRIVISKNMQLQPGGNSVVTAIPAINKGIYYVKMQVGYVTVTKAVLTE